MRRGDRGDQGRGVHRITCRVDTVESNGRRPAEPDKTATGYDCGVSTRCGGGVRTHAADSGRRVRQVPHYIQGIKGHVPAGHRVRFPRDDDLVDPCLDGARRPHTDPVCGRTGVEIDRGRRPVIQTDLGLARSGPLHGDPIKTGAVEIDRHRGPGGICALVGAPGCRSVGKGGPTSRVDEARVGFLEPGHRWAQGHEDVLDPVGISRHQVAGQRIEGDLPAVRTHREGG